MREKKEEIKIFGKDAVAINWLVLVLLAGVVISGGILFKEFLFHELDIYGGILNEIPHFSWMIDIHMYSAIGLLGVGLLHVILNIGRKEVEILPKNPAKEIKGVIHTFLFLMFLAPREEMGSHGKYQGHQRLSYIAFIFKVGVLGITAGIMQISFLHEYGFLIHIIMGIFLIWFVFYRGSLHLRKRDKVKFRAYFVTGTLPEWYVRKYHYLWYRELTGRLYQDPPVEIEEVEAVEETTVAVEQKQDNEITNEVVA